MSNEFQFKPTEISTEVKNKYVIERLPEWMQSSEQIQLFCNDIIQQWFNPAEQQLQDGYIGEYGSPVASGRIFIPEKTVARKEYQLSPAYISSNDDLSVRSLQFYPDLVNLLDHYGALVQNEDRLFESNYYSWTPPINPNKLQNFSTYVWDKNNSFGILTPDYIVMECGALNGNAWSLQNFWYTVGDELPDGKILTEALSMTSRFSRAQVPIIEYNKNIELVNHGIFFRGIVDLISTSMKPEDIVQRRIEDEIRVDGRILADGDRILFTSIGNSGENNRIYKVFIDVMANGSRVYGLVLDENEESDKRPSGEPLLGDTVLIKYGNENANKSFVWNGSHWVETQQKTSTNVSPMFKLYDINGYALDDLKQYPNSNFKGSPLFGLKINYSYPKDTRYDAHVELNQYNYFIFENFLQSTRYEYMKFGSVTPIDGLYYYKRQYEDNGEIRTTLVTDWVRSTNKTRQYIHQVPEITKNSMYRIFNTITDMNTFTDTIENMYAYVIENDQYYKFYKADNSTFSTWHVTNDEILRSDVFENTFELAQKVKLEDGDILEVYIDGEQAYEGIDYQLTKDGAIDKVIIDRIEHPLSENSIVSIRTYSQNKEYNPEIGAYEIPINLKNNPYNESIDFIDQSEYSEHMSDIIRQNITTGSVTDNNNYEQRLRQGLVDNSKGTHIIQNEGSLLPLLVHTANEDLNLFEAIMFNQAEYFRFKNKFNSKLVSLYQENSQQFLSTPPSLIVDNILEFINVGKDNTFPFAFSNMGTTIGNTEFIPSTPQFLGILPVYQPQKNVSLIIGTEPVRYNIDHCGIATKSYTAINGIAHMDDVIYELEKRIYDSIDSKFKEVDYQRELDISDLQPSAYYTDTQYSIKEFNTLLLRGYVNFVASKGLSNNIHRYDPNDWKTWNFTGTTYMVDGKPTDIPARGSWRAIYTDVYGTYRPYSHPWEMFGFSIRPDWFNIQYKPTKVRLSNDVNDYMYVYTDYVINEAGDKVPSGLWDTEEGAGDASTGTIAGGSRAGTYAKYRRFGGVPFTIRDTGNVAPDGEKIQEIILRSPLDGMITGALSHREEPWVVGDMGDLEFTYMNTPMFAFDKAQALLKAKPAQFANYFYDTRGTYIQEVAENGGKQFLYGSSKERLNLNKNTVVHSEQNTRVVGYQSWVSDFLINQNKNVTNRYGNILRSSNINLGYRLGAFSESKHLTFTSDTFGLISQENQHIGLVRSYAKNNNVLSALKITWTGSGYSISGYDLVSSVLKYYSPLKTSKRRSVKIGNTQIIHYSDYNYNIENELNYGTVFASKQDVYTFICSYGKYLESKGWIFDEVINNEINNWDRIAEAFVSWSNTPIKKGDFISVSPSTSSVRFGTTFGSIESVSQFNGGIWTIIDDQNNGIRPDEIDTVRLGNVITVRLNEDVDKRIALLRINTVSYEHAVIFDNKTIFGNTLYIPKFGAAHEIIKMYGYVTSNWTGRLQAPGFMILESGTLPNFEKLVTDFNDYYNNDAPVNNTDITDLSRHVIGFQTRDYLRTLISSETSQVDFYKGFIKEKGTKQSFEKVLRVSKTYNTENYKALEEWAFKVGTYGNTEGVKNIQFRMVNSEFNQDPQMFTFNEFGKNDITNSTYINYNSDSPDWIRKPRKNVNFSTLKLGDVKNNFPDIGCVAPHEVDFYTESFSTVYQSRMDYIQKFKTNPSKVWVFGDYNNVWNIYTIVNTGVKLRTINKPDDVNTNIDNKFVDLVLDKPSTLKDGDYFFFVDNSTYMPDVLKKERIFINTGKADNIITVNANLNNELSFNSNEPVLYKYVPFFKTEKEKQDFIDARKEIEIPDITKFEKPTVYNSITNSPEVYIGLYDPMRNIFNGTIMSNIDYICTNNPALYNSHNGSTVAWGSEKVGKVWWDTSKAYFYNYNIPILNDNGTVNIEKTLENKRANYGKLLSNASIDVYEWVKSPVLPESWNKYCKTQSKQNKLSTEWIPSGEPLGSEYSTFIEYDKVSGTYIRYYFFWVKNAMYIPNINGRTKSVNEIENCLRNPMQLNTPWFAPCTENSFIISGLSPYVTDSNLNLSISYGDIDHSVLKHEQYQLCKEGLSYNFNKNLWNSMFASLIGESNYNGISTSLVYPDVELGSKPDQTWFKNIFEARRTFVDSANKIYKAINMTTNRTLMDEIFDVTTSERNPNLIDMKILTVNNELLLMPEEDRFKENDAVIVDSTGTLPKPLSANDVYFVHITDNGYIKLMSSPSTIGSATITIDLVDKGEGKMNMIKQTDYIESLGTSLDMTRYWTLTDWYSEGYNEYTPYTIEPSLDVAEQKGYKEGDVIRVTGTDNIWTLYELNYTRTVPIWKAVGRQNSTIRLNSLLYENTNMYNADGSLSSIEVNIRKALTLLKGSFDSVQSILVFDMVKYAHTEQKVIDWVFKTSYIYVIGLEQKLRRSYVEQDNLITQIVAYFEEAKPYRTKIRSQIEQKASDEDEINGIMNDLDPNGYVEVNGKFIKTESDVFDIEYAVLNTFTGKWEKHGSLPDDFKTPNRRFQEINTVLQFDNTQCVPNVEDDEHLRLAFNNADFVSQKDDIHTVADSYLLSKFKYTHPSITPDYVDGFISSDLPNKYPWMRSTTVTDQIQEGLLKFKDSIEDTNRFLDEISTLLDSFYGNDDLYRIVSDYVKYNTLVNRVALSGRRDQAPTIVGCPFKGRVITDNSNTRLPVGFSSYSNYNVGYNEFSTEMLDKFIALVYENHPDIKEEEEVDWYLAHDYGLYRWADEFKVIQPDDEPEEPEEPEDPNTEYPDDVPIYYRNIEDLTDVIGLALGVNLADTDYITTIKDKLYKEVTNTSVVYVSLPRKYVKAISNNTKDIVEIPIYMSLDQFAETQFVMGDTVTLVLDDNCMDDLALTTDSVLYSDYKEVLDGINEFKYYNDMNAFDNLALESSTKEVHIISKDKLNKNDSPFIDISEINPDGLDITNLRFTVNGYNHDHVESQLAEMGNFQIEGHVILNPYNKKEAIVSIPKYEEAISYMDRNAKTQKPMNYTFHVKNISKTGEMELSNHNLVKGDSVMIFTPDGDDLYIQHKTGRWDLVLDVNKIKENNRPKIFKVIDVKGTKVKIEGLTLDNDITAYTTDVFYTLPWLPVNIVKVVTFNDSIFVKDGIQLYSQYREYKVSMLDYEVFYDRMVIQPNYTDNFVSDDYDSMYMSNEIFEVDGVETDNGYYMPIYGQGSLSELTRIKPMENLQIFIYEYNAAKDKANLSVLLSSSDSTVSKIIYPTGLKDYTYLNGSITSRNIASDDLITSEKGSMLHALNSQYVLRGIYNSPEINYETGISYNIKGIHLGKLGAVKAIEYIKDFDTSKGLSLSKEEIKTVRKL